MNNANGAILNDANRQAALNTFAYISTKVDVTRNMSFGSIVKELNKTAKDSADRKLVDKLLVSINNDETLNNMVLVDQVSEENGMNAFAFLDADGNASVVFKGTGNGEWQGNGEALSGIPEENTYLTYGKEGNVILSETVSNDYASDQQVKALNWFNKLVSEQSWTVNNNITVSGHSAGGNKAQFITINSPLVDKCYSFDGQGFSPEAVQMFKDRFGKDYELRLKKLYGFSAYNDYVNVLGERIIPEDNINLLKCSAGDSNIVAYHYMESILGDDGKLNGFAAGYGDVSVYVSELSAEVMKIEPEVRRYVTAGVMKVCQEFLGDGAQSVGGNIIGEHVDVKETPTLTTILGLIIAAGPITAEGIELIHKKLEDGGEKITKSINGVTALTPVHQTMADAASTGMVSMLFATSGLVRTGVFTDCATALVNEGVKFANKIKTANVDVHAKILGFINFVSGSLRHRVNSILNPGYIYAGDYPELEVDTAKLRMYANRLNVINNRLSVLDNRLNSLYKKVGLRDLHKLIIAGVLTCKSYSIAQNAKYLNETADDFDAVERDIRSKF